MASDALVGVVTVTYNGEGVLPDFFRCMFTQTHHEFLLFAVDNLSKDASVAMLRQCADSRLRTIINEENVGVAEANNQGIRAALDAGCEFVLLLNNDTEFDEDLLSKLIEGLRTYHADMVCPKILYFSEQNRIWAAGGGFLPFQGYMSTHYGENEIDSGQYDSVKRVDYVPTCCVLISANVFDRIGMMDSRYFVYVDDTDFMFRAMKAGVSLYYLPELRLLHKVGQSTGGEESPFSIRFGTRNRLFFLFKHFGMLPVLPWLLICRVVWFLRSRKRPDGAAWLKIKKDAFRESLQMWRDDGSPLIRL